MARTGAERVDGRIQQAWGKLVKGRGGSWPLSPCGAAGCFSCAVEAAPASCHLDLFSESYGESEEEVWDGAG